MVIHSAVPKHGAPSSGSLLRLLTYVGFQDYLIFLAWKCGSTLFQCPGQGESGSLGLHVQNKAKLGTLLLGARAVRLIVYRGLHCGSFFVENPQAPGPLVLMSRCFRSRFLRPKDEQPVVHVLLSPSYILNIL